MQINDIFTDLHGNQYEIMDFHVLGPDYPLFQDNRDAILTSSTQDEHINLIIRGNDQLIIYNEHHKVYWMYDIKFIQHFDKFDIRKGFYNEKKISECDFMWGNGFGHDDRMWQEWGL